MNCCAHIVAANSARNFQNPAPVLLKSQVRELLARHVTGQVLEIGGGCLRNSRYLQSLGFSVSVVELSSVQERFASHYRRFVASGGHVVNWPKDASKGPRLPGGRFRIAVVTFVLETICQPSERLRLLRTCRHALDPRGALVISVRGTADVETAQRRGVPCSDGYFTPLKTFIRPYNRRQLALLLGRAGFKGIRFLHSPKSREPELLHAIAHVR
jgi:hypothetical protein